MFDGMQESNEELYLDVSTFDLVKGSNVQHRCLAGQALELERAQPGPVEPVPGRVSEHEP